MRERAVVAVVGDSVRGALHAASRCAIEAREVKKDDEPPTLLQVSGHEVRITHPSKLYFAARGETKLDLVRCYFMRQPARRLFAARSRAARARSKLS